MARITAPVEGFTGHVGGVEFTDGVAESGDPHHLNYFRRHGYGVDERVEEPAQHELDDEPTVDPVSEQPEDDEADDDEPVAVRPAVNAPKADWVAYAVVALGLDEAEADAESKQALIDRADQQ